MVIPISFYLDLEVLVLEVFRSSGEVSMYGVDGVQFSVNRVFEAVYCHLKTEN